MTSAPPTRHADPAPAPRHAPASPTPLWPILTVVFVASLGTGVVTNGIYFITEHGYRFTQARNYLLGVVLGVTYIAGSLAAGPLMRWLTASERATSRGALVLIFAALGALCAIPIAFRAAHTAWPIWALVILYTPLTGLLWPIMEAYVSGGRRAAPLRAAIGRFNYVWSGAIIPAYLLITPLLKVDPAATGAPLRPAIGIAILGATHLLTILLLPLFPPEPGRHLADHHEPHPESWTRLLTTFRILLPTSYIVLTALLPYLPDAFNRLGIPTRFHMLLAATWLAARVGTFFILSRWQGWHGRWYPPVLGGVLMLAGFGVTVLAPSVASPGSAAIIATVLGLACFGVGMAVIYCGALYYAMEVGDAQVEAGGAHEALIGVGYTAGPLLGLLAVGAESMGVLPTRSFEIALLTSVAAVAIVAAAIVAHRTWRSPASRP